MERTQDRNFEQLRPVRITRGYLMHPDGSVLMEAGDTKVICTAMVEEGVPRFLKGTGQGWVTSEYAMLPGSTGQRKQRSVSKGRIDGRSSEIQRLIGRSLRNVVDLDRLGERTIWIDCDVIQADGGTRTAAITGAYVALSDALDSLVEKGILKQSPLKAMVAAVSVGLVRGIPMLDLCYEEDSQADVDMNVVMTDKGEFIEIQGTGENAPFSRAVLEELLRLAGKGIAELHAHQSRALKA